MAAAEGSEGESSFTATQGVQWLATLSGDGWLGWSGTNPGTFGDEAPEEPQVLKVQATSANPSAQARTGKITVKAGASVGDPAYTALKQEIAVEQKGSTVTGSEITIGAEGVSNQKSSFKATAGLDWAASKTVDWITLTGGASGSPTTGESQDITFDVPLNPSSSSRKSEITVRAGNTDTGPTGKIEVTQNASSLTAGDPATLAATKGAAGSLKITGTSGLPLMITPPSWVEITTDPVPVQTNGSQQTVEYKTKEVNLNSTERDANISVNAGDITQTVAIKQSGSTFTVSETELPFEKAGGSKTVTVNGTSGLPWTVSSSVATNDITSDITSSDANGTDQTLTFTATENTGGARSATFTIAVTGGDHSKTVEVKQAAALTGISVTIDQSVLTSYRTKTTNMTQYPPFNYDGTNKLPNGCTFDGTATMTGSYTIQVEKGQRAGYANYSTMQSYCSSLNEDGTGWRIPTQIELHAMYINKSTIEGSTGASPFISSYYWSSSVCGGNSNGRCLLDFSSGSFGSNTTSDNYYVRCVRDN